MVSRTLISGVPQGLIVSTQGGRQMGRIRVVSLLVLMALVLSAPLFAQQGTSSIAGKVTDAQEAVLPGVAIVVTNEETGIFREVTTSGEGTYLVTQIVPGRYKVTAKLDGFRTM